MTSTPTSTKNDVGALAPAFGQRRFARPAVWGVLIVAVLLVPLVVTDMYARLILVQMVTYALLASSWNLTLGIAGIFNYAHVALFGIGSYASAILAVQFDIDPWLTIPAAGLAALIGSLVAFIPVARLRGIYVALATFIFAQLCIYIVLGQSDLTGGSSGLVGVPDMYVGDTSMFANSRLGYVYLGIGFLIVVVVGLTLLLRSTFGRSLLAIKDNEQLARSRGIPVYRQHLITFLTGSLIAGLTGSYFVFTNNVASIDVFSFGYATLLLSMIFLGGSRSIIGPVIGAVVITLISEALRNYGPIRFIVAGVIILIVLRFFPTGIVGGFERIRDLVPRRRRHHGAPSSGATTSSVPTEESRS